MKAKKFLYNSLGFLICLLPIACKKLSNYNPTIVVGRVTNLATGQGIPNALMVLKAYGNGFTLPQKANIEIETRTDTEGNYRFEFDAYAAIFNGRKTAVYSVQYNTEGKLIEWFAGEGQGSTINLRDFYKDDFVSSSDKCNSGFLPHVGEVKRSETSPTWGRANKSIFALPHERKIFSAYPGTKIQVGSIFRSRKESNPHCRFTWSK